MLLWYESTRQLYNALADYDCCMGGNDCCHPLVAHVEDGNILDGVCNFLDDSIDDYVLWKFYKDKPETARIIRLDVNKRMFEPTCQCSAAATHQSAVRAAVDRILSKQMRVLTYLALLGDVSVLEVIDLHLAVFQVVEPFRFANK